jgi:hypothetical protein
MSKEPTFAPPPHPCCRTLVPQDANSSFSLYGLLNRCRTPMGKRRLRVGAASHVAAAPTLSCLLSRTRALRVRASVRSTRHV